MGPTGLLRDFRMVAVWAGLTAAVWYAFGALPLQIAVADRLGLDAARTSSWIFIVWFGGAISSIALTLAYRQPIPITWSIPGLVYLGTLAGQFSLAEIAGANLLAGIAIVIVGLLGLGGRILAWLPLPLAMGMFAGSILGDLTRLIRVTVEDAVVAGATVLGYVVGRLVNNPRVPPLGLAVLAGAVAIALAQRATAAAVAWSPPALIVPEMHFSLAAFVAITVPLVILAVGLGNVQGLGFLIAQGYRVPVDRITVVVGVNSVLNALLSGHTAIVARTGVSIVASPDAGPVSGRYWANLVAASLTIVIALAAGPVTSLLSIVPSAYIVALAGLAILASFQEALTKAFEGPLRFGAVVAFLVAATPFALAGVTSAFWALLAGVLASLVAERDELLAHWRSGGHSGGVVPPSDSGDLLDEEPLEYDVDASGTLAAMREHER